MSWSYDPSVFNDAGGVLKHENALCITLEQSIITKPDGTFTRVFRKYDFVKNTDDNKGDEEDMGVYYDYNRIRHKFNTAIDAYIDTGLSFYESVIRIYILNMFTAISVYDIKSLLQDIIDETLLQNEHTQKERVQHIYKIIKGYIDVCEEVTDHEG